VAFGVSGRLGLQNF